MSKKPLKVIAGAPDKPLVIGDIEIPCYVLEGETRVLSQGGFLQAIGRARTPVKARDSDVDRSPSFLAAKNLSPYVSKELVTSSTPIAFQAPSRGPVAHGYRAELLPEVCKVYVEAQRAGALLPSQAHIAARAEVLRDGLGVLGIIGLVDEATGYQRIREERALATILEKIIAKDLQPWTKTFPYEFYELIYKLKGWSGPDGHKRTPLIGKYTNDIVYERLPPGVFEELKARTPRLASGSLRNKLFQWFTPDFGHPKLKEHLAAVMALMRAAANWTRFMSSLNRAFPKLNKTIPLPLDG